MRMIWHFKNVIDFISISWYELKKFEIFSFTFAKHFHTTRRCKTTKGMRSSIFSPRTSYYAKPPRWKKRLLYSLAFFGAVALSGLTFMIYLALQVPEDQLHGGIPFPKLSNTIEKTGPIPEVKTTVTEKPPTVGGVPAYALFYTTKSDGDEQSKLGTPRLRHRPKPIKRTQSAVKAKRSS
jgi:hypothetical protein